MIFGTLIRTAIARLFLAAGRRAEAGGRATDAREKRRAAVRIAPRYAPAHLYLGISLEETGDAGEALRSYERALEVEPRNALANYNLGKLRYLRGELEPAEHLLRAALESRPAFPEANVLLSNVHDARGNLAGAAAELEKAISQRPDYAGALLNYAIVLQKLGRPRGEAISCYEKALAAEPNLAAAHWQLGNLLADEARLDEASERFRKALAVEPDFAEAEKGLCLILREQGRPVDAIACLRRVVARHAEFPGGHLALGTLLAEEGELDESEAQARRVLALDPRLTAAHLLLGNVFRARGDAARATQCYREAAHLDPGSAEARWSLAVAHLQPVYTSDEASAEGRRAFAGALGDLEKWIGEERLAAGFKVVGEPPPFYLAYQEENNHELLGRYGSLCARIMAPHQPSPTRPRRERPIRAVVVSAHLYNHSVWNALMKGWFQQHDAARFELEALHLGKEHDRETEAARSLASHFETGQGSFDGIVAAIARRQPDIVLYPEIGMDSLTYKLASLRLAPVQVATWGHPETSGLPTIDYFVSGEDLEPEDASANYTEKLVLLPRLGCTYPSRQVVAAPADFGGNTPQAEVPLLVCPGTPFKYAPNHDGVLMEIARQLGNCRFVLFTYRIPEISHRLEQRLRAGFAARGLDPDKFLLFAPWQSPAQFRGLMAGARVFLDTLGFSGFNTAMEAVECGLPIVAREARFLRGRFAGSILRRMKLNELIADSDDSYVALAVKLCRDESYRAKIRARMEAARPMLFDDPAPAAALDELLARLGAESRTQ